MWRPISFLIIGFVFALACVGVVDRAVSSQTTAEEEKALADLEPDEARTVSVFHEASKSVVFVTNMRRTRAPFFFTGHWEEETPQGQGSGFIWDKEGHIVTNFHVIEGATSLTVTLADQSSYDAKVVGLAPHKDLAVLKIDVPDKNLKPISAGTSANLMVGQKVLAIGDPFGFYQSLTTGVVSALGRQIKSPTGVTIYDVIQTDAAINPGNSGGPLLDSKGRLIGVNAAILSPSGSSAGIGFAIPVDTVKMVVPELIQYGAVTRPGLGIQILNDSYRPRFGLESGVIVYLVEPDGSADQSGMEGLMEDERGRVILGDVIIGIDKWAVRNSAELNDLLNRYKVDDEVTVHVMRGGTEPLELKVTLQAVR